MAESTNKKAKLFDIKLFPQDLARLVCACLPMVYRIKRLTPEGEKYHKILRGGAIIASNHTSFADPFLVGTTFWYRRVFFLVAEVVMQGRLRSLLLKGIGSIKVERSITDIEAIKKSVNTLKQGHVLTIFPQGGIVKDNDMENIKSGAVLIALQAGVPIIPIYLCERKHWYNRQKVIIGETIYPNKYCTKKMPSTSDIKNITDILMNEMNRCVPKD